MVNIGFFYDGSDTPSGYTEIDSIYRDRLILSGGTVYETGGSDTHTHSISGWGCSGPSSRSLIGGGSTNPNCGVDHSHYSGSFNINSSNHLPPYKNLRVIQIAYNNWNGKVPSGSIVFSESVPTGFTRYDDGSSYFIRISSTAGGTGGSSTHYHGLNGQTGTPTTSGTTNDGGRVSAPSGHTHTFSGSSSTSSSSDYYYWECGLVKAASEISLAVNCIIIADGSLPSNHWEEVTGSSGRFLKKSSTNNIAIGGSSLSLSHIHSFSGTTDQQTGSVSSISYDSYYIGSVTHTHTISFTLSSSAPTPSYVRLKLYKLIYSLSRRVVNSIVI